MATRDRFSTGVVCVLLALLAALLTGCTQSAAGGESDEGPSTTAPVSPSATRASGFGAVFLAVDECSSFGKASFTEVPCTSERAAARVVARHDGTPAGGPPRPAPTALVRHTGEKSKTPEGEGGGAGPRGSACRRNVKPPHPGDPGGGGGPRTIVGDCVYGSGSGQVRETAC